MKTTYPCKWEPIGEQKLALRRRDAQQLLVKRAANLQLQQQIRKATYMAELEHEHQRIRSYQSQMGASFPSHMRARQVQIEEEIRNIK